jgi:hypothetical protein
MGRRFMRSENALGELVDGELVLLNIESGEYFGLNRTGSRVWELLGEVPDLDRVHEELALRYRVDRQLLREDLNDLVAELERAGLIREVVGG